MRTLLIGLLILAAAATSAGAYTVSTDHPRIILTPARVAECQARIESAPYSTWWGQALDATRRAITYDYWTNGQYLSTAAFCYAVSDSTEILNWIQHTLRARYATARGFSGEGDGGDSAPGCVSSVVLALDWCYDDLAPTLRDSVLFLLADVSLGSARDGVPPVAPPVTCTSGSAHLARGCAEGGQYMAYSLALYGEGVCDALASQTFDIERCHFYNYWLPSYNEISFYGAVEGYLSARFWSMFGMAEALWSSCGETDALTYGYIANAGNYWIHRYDGDLFFSHNVAKVITGYQPRLSYAAMFQGYLTNPYSALWGSVVDTLTAHYNQSYPAGEYYGSTYTGITAWPAILYYDDGPAHSTTADSLSYFDQGGLTFARSGWDFGPASTVTTSMFSVLPRIADGYRAGHFLITRGGDRLLTDSGTYSSESDDCFIPYHNSCTAHNVPAIEVPGEVNEWPGKISPTAHVTVSQSSVWGGSIEVPVDGACYYPDADSAVILWPLSQFSSCSPPPGVCRGYLGRMMEFRDEPLSLDSYCYTRALLTAQYRFAANRATREFVFVRPDLFIVRDVITLTDSSYQVRTRFHSIERPEPNATVSPCSILRERGTPWAEDLGGVYRLPFIRDFLISRGSSEAQVLIVRPGPGNGSVRIVGGPNWKGEAWKQEWHTQITNPVLKSPWPSYEFWLEDLGDDGKNFLPGTASLTQAAVDARNTYRHKYSADWRFEVQSPTGLTRQEMIAVIAVGGTGMSHATATYNDATSTLIVVRDGATTTVVFTPNGGLVSIEKI